MIDSTPSRADRKQQTRTLLIETALDLMAERGIAATRTIDAGTYSLPPKEIMDKALELWREVGLPEFEIPKRARNLIDKS